MFAQFENIIIVLISFLWLALLWHSTAKQISAKRMRFADNKIFRRITGHKPTKRPVIKSAFIAFALFLTGLGLMRPVGGFYDTELMVESLDMVITLDVSRSMLAEDIEGNSRLRAAKVIIERLVGLIPGDRLGLVLFAGESVVQSPLSQDRGTFLTFLQRAHPDIMARQGTDLVEALQTSIDRFDMSSDNSRVILLVTDGDGPDQNFESVLKEAKEKNIMIFVLAVGTERGARIPLGSSWYGRREYLRYRGSEVVTRLNMGRLQNIAKATHASVFKADSVAAANNIADSLADIPRIVVSAGKMESRYELYYIPVFFAFILLIFEWVISDRIPYEREKDHWLKRI